MFEKVRYMTVSKPDSTYVLVVLNDEIRILNPDLQWEASDITIPGLSDIEIDECIFVVHPTKRYAYIAFINQSQLHHTTLSLTTASPKHTQFSLHHLSLTTASPKHTQFSLHHPLSDPHTQFSLHHPLSDPIPSQSIHPLNAVSFALQSDETTLSIINLENTLEYGYKVKSEDYEF